MRGGKKVMVYCGPSRELKTLRLKALETIPDSKIVIYYGDSEKQREVEDMCKISGQATTSLASHPLSWFLSIILDQ